MLMMAMTTRSSINVKARSQAVSRGDQESVRVLTVPLLGTVKSGFMVSMQAKKRKEAVDEPAPAIESQPALEKRR